VKNAPSTARAVPNVAGVGGVGSAPEPRYSYELALADQALAALK